MNKKPKIVSVVIPFLNEKDNFPLLYERLCRVFQEQSENMEIIFVDDGSTDGSAAWVREQSRRDGRVRLLQLSRNYGHQIAITAGLDHAEGDAVVIMDADLQDPPEVIPALLAKWREGYEVVSAVRRSRQGETWCKKFFAAVFYRLFRALVKVDVPLNAGDFRLLDHQVVLALRQMRETHRFLRAMTSWTGYRHATVEYDRAPRHAGETKYPIWKSLQLAVDAITSFSASPLRWIIGFGGLVSLIGMFYIVQIIWYHYFRPIEFAPGWASIMALMLFLGGIQLVCLGMIGQYISRIFDESKKRPLYFIKETKE